MTSMPDKQNFFNVGIISENVEIARIEYRYSTSEVIAIFLRIIVTTINLR